MLSVEGNHRTKLKLLLVNIVCSKYHPSPEQPSIKTFIIPQFQQVRNEAVHSLVSLLQGSHLKQGSAGEGWLLGGLTGSPGYRSTQVLTGCSYLKMSTVWPNKAPSSLEWGRMGWTTQTMKSRGKGEVSKDCAQVPFLIGLKVHLQRTNLLLIPRDSVSPSATSQTSSWVFQPNLKVGGMPQSPSAVSNYLQPHGLYSPWNSPGQNTRVGSRSLLQGIFPTQGSNSGLPRCRQILYQQSQQRSPRIRECYSAIKNNETMPLVPTRMGLEIVII